MKILKPMYLLLIIHGKNLPLREIRLQIYPERIKEDFGNFAV